MSVEYAPRALADFVEITKYYALTAGVPVAQRFEARFRAVLERVEKRPQTAQAVNGRAGVRMAPMLTFPYKIFYREVGPGTIRILHIRHMSRRPSD